MLTDTTEIHDMYSEVSGALAFDVGANGGQVSNLLAENFETVIACEPSDEPYAYLVEHGAPNVRPLHVAVSAKAGKLLLQEREMSASTGYLFTGDTLPEWGAVVAHHTVVGTTLDQLTEAYGYPAFVKIDTEGHECLVMRGGRETFRYAAEQFVIEIHSRDNGEEAQHLLKLWYREFRIVRHEQHLEKSDAWHDHYWLVNA